MSESQTLVPTSGMTFDKQVMILRGFVVLSDFGNNPIHYKRVVSTLNVARTQVSGTNSFFVGLGLLQQVDDGTYIPTSCAIDYYSQKLGDEDYSKIKPCVENSELFQLVRNITLIRSNMQENEIINEILRISKTKNKARAKRALEWLEKCSLIEIGDDGSISSP